MKDHRISLFLAVIRAGGFSKAARELGVTQPAVSQNISALEKELGVTLFERSRFSVSLTPEGRIFMDYATRIDALYDEVSAVFSPAMRPKEQPVGIATTDFIATHILPSVLQRMEELTGATFAITTYPENTDFQQLLSNPSPSGALFPDRPADLAVILSPAAPANLSSATPHSGIAGIAAPNTGPSFTGLSFTVLSTPRFSSKPFAALLQSLL